MVNVRNDGYISNVHSVDFKRAAKVLQLNGGSKRKKLIKRNLLPIILQPEIGAKRRHSA